MVGMVSRVTSTKNGNMQGHNSICETHTHQGVEARSAHCDHKPEHYIGSLFSAFKIAAGTHEPSVREI
jgi:hypothetical protein